jgi:hypothetical protein
MQLSFVLDLVLLRPGGSKTIHHSANYFVCFLIYDVSIKANFATFYWGFPYTVGVPCVQVVTIGNSLESFTNKLFLAVFTYFSFNY